MKKLFAISMIALHLFNVAGYNFLFDYNILQSDKQVVQRLDNNQYSDSELIEVKVKLNLPYMTVFGEYERMDGEYELNGEYYKYVKRKIADDTLYLLCLQDYSKSELYKGKTQYASKANDIPSKDQSGSFVKKGVFAGEYYCEVRAVETLVCPVVINKFASIVSTLLTDTYPDTTGQPPEII